MKITNIFLTIVSGIISFVFCTTKFNMTYSKSTLVTLTVLFGFWVVYLVYFKIVHKVFVEKYDFPAYFTARLYFLFIICVFLLIIILFFPRVLTWLLLALFYVSYWFYRVKDKASIIIVDNKKKKSNIYIEKKL